MDIEANFDQKYYLSVHTLTAKQPSIVSIICEVKDDKTWKSIFCEKFSYIELTV